jgi:hypothetical protein
MERPVKWLLVLFLIGVCPAYSIGQAASPAAGIAGKVTSQEGGGQLPRLGVGAKLSSLGIGVEGATAITHRSNLRGGFNFLDYTRGLNKDAIDYNGRLQFRSAEAHYDFYLFRGFHVSPGLLAFFGNPISSTASVQGGANFSLGGVSYFSDPTNPVNGTASLSFQRKVAPSVLLGFGNLLPRSGRHFGMNFEFGAAFQGAPNVALNFTGNACASTFNGSNFVTTCRPIQTDPTIQSNVLAEEQKINNTLKPFRFYPLISMGFSWRVH